MLSERPARIAGGGKGCPSCRWCGHHVRKQQQKERPVGFKIADGQLRPWLQRAKVQSSMVPWFEAQEKLKELRVGSDELSETVFQQVLLLVISSEYLEPPESSDIEETENVSSSGSIPSDEQESIGRLLDDNFQPFE